MNEQTPHRERRIINPASIPRSAKAGKPDGHLLEKMKKICRRAGIESANLHQLRHFFATHLRMQGTSLADIGELLGHRDLETTQIYAKVQQEQLRSQLLEQHNSVIVATQMCHTPRKTQT